MSHPPSSSGSTPNDDDDEGFDLDSIEVDIDLGVVPREVSPHDLAPYDTASPPDVSPHEVDACDPARAAENKAKLAALRARIEAERRESLREREDHDSDGSFPASDPPANY
ncbi:MAG: hypothetical protein R3B09_25100 [Nannocystaceae bacterium]